MKKAIRTFLIFLILPFLFSARFSAAGAAYDDSIHRFNCFVDGFVSETEERELDDLIFGMIDDYSFDFPVCVFDSLPDGMALSDYSERFFSENGFGWGENKDGVLFLVDLKNGEIHVSTYGGRAKSEFTDEELQSALSAFNSSYDRSNAAESIRAYLRSISASLQYDSRDYARVTDGSMPYWYPADVSSFIRFHGIDLPHVVDDAGLFSESEKADLSQRISSLIGKYAERGIDFVIFTDRSSYGLGEAVYSADFYYFNGYGIGENYTGSVFFLNMDPYDRCWWSAATGDVQDLFDDYEINIEPIDDAIEPYLRSGDYYGAMVVYINCLDSLYEDAFILPDWYPEDKASFSHSYIPDLPRVIDHAGILSEEQEKQFSDRLSVISEKYGIDAVFFTDRGTHSMSTGEYAEDYYYYNGYWENGFIFCVIGNPDSGSCRWATRTFGSCDRTFSGDAISRLNERFYDDAGSNYGKAFSLYLESVR